MMVDKAVSTNDNNHDTLKYEKVFSSLIENKILAIKRDCEEKSKLKRSKSFRRIIFGKKIFCACNSKKSSIGSANDIEKDKTKLDYDIEKGKSKLDSSEEKSVKEKENDETTTIIQDENTISILRTENEKHYDEKILYPKISEIEKNIDCSIRSPDSSLDSLHKSDDSNNGSSPENGIKNLVVKVLTHHQNDDVSRTNQFTDMDSITHLSTNSIGSINLDLTTTQADDSITSIKNSIESLPYPIYDDDNGVNIYDNKDLLKNHILEARSISAQCSPILPRPERYNTYNKSQVSYMDNYYNYPERQINFLSRQNTSEDSANLTISTLVLNNNSNKEFDDTKYYINNNRKSKSTSILVISNSDNVNTNVINRLDSNNFNLNTYLNNNLDTVIKRKQSLESSSNNYKTVPKTIITKSKTLSENVSKLQRMVSTSTASSPVPSGCCASSKSKERELRTKLVRSSEHCSSDDEYRKRKRKYKRHHRCSDPVLVYPTSGGLQHCILSMPPNQPIEFHYNEGYKYDMQLDLENDKTCDLDNILPTHRTHKHRHHKHKKKHKHKKPKILVHDLDTQIVKVIDPDDLPQRARWTIIATACLLLLMCLMLVGITLRMAPIIDDMVRQENERLMHESMNRARLAKNFTEYAASLAAFESIP